MIVGVLNEIKAEENRVSMIPAGVEVMKQNGHEIIVEQNAGKGSGFNDTACINAGAVPKTSTLALNNVTIPIHWRLQIRASSRRSRIIRYWKKV